MPTRQVVVAFAASKSVPPLGISNLSKPHPRWFVPAGAPVDQMSAPVHTFYRVMADTGVGTEEGSSSEARDSNVRARSNIAAGALEQGPQSQESYKVPYPEGEELGKDEPGTNTQMKKLFGDEPRPRRILVAVDASRGSIYALQLVLSSIATRNDSIILFHAYPDVEILYPFRSAPVHMLLGAQQRHKHRSETLLKTLSDLVEKLQVQVKTVCVKGDVRDALQDAARRLHPDLLVIGSHGHGVVRRTLLGTVSDYVARHVECPVLIVKPPPSQQSGAAQNILPGLDELGSLTAQAA